MVSAPESLVSQSPAPEAPPPEGVIEFPDGLPGLDDQRRFVLLQPEGLEPLVVLASLDDRRVSLAAVSARRVWTDYRVSLSEEDWRSLEVGPTGERDPAGLLCLAVVILPSACAAATCNLFAPIIIHPRTRRGRQVAQLGSDYPMLHRLGPEAPTAEEARDVGAS